MDDGPTLMEEKRDAYAQEKAFWQRLVLFWQSILVAIVLVGVYIWEGGLFLFVCKLAQSNILPTNVYCAPYTAQTPDLDAIWINAFPTPDDTSAKLQFPLDRYNASHVLLDMLRDWKSHSGSFLVQYMATILEKLTAWNYSVCNTVCASLHSIVPEWMILLLGPWMTVVLLVLLLLSNYVYLMYLWFAELTWFFQRKTKEGKWDALTWLQPIQLMFSAWLAMCFAVGYFVGYPLLALVPLVWTLACPLSLLFYHAVMQPGEGDEMHAFSFVRAVFQHHKSLVMMLIGLAIAYLAFTRLDATSSAVTALLLVLSYGGMILGGLFERDRQTKGWTALSSYTQAAKTCADRAPTSGPPRGFLSRLFFGNYK